MSSEVIDVTWFNVGKRSELQCPSCGSSLNDYLPSCDHHPVQCDACNETLVVVSTTNKSIAIDLSKSPLVVQRFFQWCHSSLDELEFVSLLVGLEEMFGV